MKKLLIIVIIIVVVVMTVFKNDDSRKDSIKIGSVEALTGFAAFWGEPTKMGADLAVEDLKKRGIDVEIIYEDSEGKPDKAVSAVQKLINIDQVDALFVNFSGPSSAASPVARENEILYAYSAFDPGSVNSNEYAIKTFFDANHECKVLSEYAKNELGKDKIGYIGLKFPFTESCSEEMAKVFGANNVFVESVASPSETDFRSSLLKLKNAGVDFAISYGYEANYEAIVNQNLELNTDVSIACVESDCYSEEIKKSVPLEYLEGSILYDFELPQEFRQKIENNYGEGINVRAAALAYDVINYMTEAIVDCGDDVKCQLDHIANNKSYESVVTGSDFGGDRIFDLKNQYYLVKDGQLEKIDLD